MHVAVLGNAGSWYCRDLQRAILERGHRYSRIDFRKLTADVAGTGPTLAADDADLSKVNAVVVRTMPPGSLEQVVFRMDALGELEAAGTLVLNPPKAIECAVDKYLTTSRLTSAGLRVPRTVVCENADSAIQAFNSLGGDVVVKPIFGSEGRGIVRVSDPELAMRTFRTLERINTVLYVQQYIEHEGFDVRVMVLDGRIVGAIRRRCTDDFRTNVSQNGRAEPCQLRDVERQAALRASAAVGTRLAGVDLLPGRQKNWYVIEVNAVPGWRAFSKVTGCDVAARIVENLENQL